MYINFNVNISASKHEKFIFDVKWRLSILFKLLKYSLLFLTHEGAVFVRTIGTQCHSRTESAQNLNPKPFPKKSVVTSEIWLIGN